MNKQTAWGTVVQVQWPIAMQNRFHITEFSFSRQSLDDADSLGYPYPDAASFDFAKRPRRLGIKQSGRRGY